VCQLSRNLALSFFSPGMNLASYFCLSALTEGMILAKSQLAISSFVSFFWSFLLFMFLQIFQYDRIYFLIHIWTLDI
jgi:hypothetical protein